MATHVFRKSAAEEAAGLNYRAFRTRKTRDGTWRALYEPGVNPAAEYAAANDEWCAWVEVTWVGGSTDTPRGDGDPRKVCVLVVTCTLDELAARGTVTCDYMLATVWLDTPDGGHYLVEPVDAERWSVFTPSAPEETPASGDRGDSVVPRSGGLGKAPRAPQPPPRGSSATSPVKRVWEIADAMPGAARREVVAACVEAGVNRNTASTQYYHWTVARRATERR